MNKILASAAIAGVLALGACGDTRSNQELNGVATWPLGGPASGPWRGEPAYTYSYSPAYSYGSSETTTTTTTTRYPGGYR